MIKSVVVMGDERNMSYKAFLKMCYITFKTDIQHFSTQNIGHDLSDIICKVHVCILLLLLLLLLQYFPL